MSETIITKKEKKTMPAFELARLARQKAKLEAQIDAIIQKRAEVEAEIGDILIKMGIAPQSEKKDDERLTYRDRILEYLKSGGSGKISDISVALKIGYGLAYTAVRNSPEVFTLEKGWCSLKQQ